MALEPRRTRVTHFAAFDRPGTLRWARHQWKGTINQHLWRPAAVSMLVPLVFIGGCRVVAPSARWFPSPDESHPILAALLSISQVTQQWAHSLHCHPATARSHTVGPLSPQSPSHGLFRGQTRLA